MISFLQPSRPKYGPPRQPQPQPQPQPHHHLHLSQQVIHAPMNQQPVRALIANVHTQSPARQQSQSQSQPQLQYFTTPIPRTQIEALPPNTTLIPQFDSSIRHPVFFTDRLHKPPCGVASGTLGNPVALGYVFNDGRKRESVVKL